MNATSKSAVARHLLAGLARMVLFTVGGLLAWSILPLVLGWQPNVVMTGSMEPSIKAGDIVVTRELPADELRPGHVLLVDDPAQQDRRLLHRYDHATDSGELVLRGDANEDVDSTPVPPEDVQGLGILRIPWVGQPFVWAAQGRFLPIVLTVLGLLALFALARIPSTKGSNDDDPAGTASRPKTTISRSGSKPVALTGTATLMVTALAVISIPASATFTADTGTTASFTAAPPAPTEPPPPVEGFQIEAESLVDAATGTAPIEAQETWGNWGFSAGAQLWFRAGQAGDSMTTTFEVPATGVYDVSAILTQAPDYGTVQVTLDGKVMGPAFDGYRPGDVATTGRLSAGLLLLEAGNHELTLTITGKDPQSTGYFAGLDRIDFEAQ